jgi:outer membrane protein assembly factor BamA
VVLGAAVASAGVLPPGDVAGRATVTNYLHDPLTGLVAGNDFLVVPYHSSFSLDAIGQPAIGVSAGGPLGTGVAGGVSFLFGDQLSDRQIGVGIQANGQVQDIGGQVIFQNLKHRWNYGVVLEHIPYLYGYAASDGTTQDIVLQRIFVDQAGLQTSYPFSSTRRIEFSAAATRLGYSTQIQSYDFYGNPISQTGAPAPPAAYYGSGSVAYVGDNSYSAFTNPIQGSRYRFEFSPTFGTLTYNSALADYREYLFARPITFAFRAMHYGRYGKSAEDPRQYQIFLGEETLMRGYNYGTFTNEECLASQFTGSSQCPVFDRLLGSRIGLMSAEIRIPVFGVPEYGLLNFPYLPLTISPFVDAGEAWTSTESASLSFAQSGNVSRGIVASAGVSARFNLLGYAILEAYAAHPFQRPTQNWVYGIQLAPGW